MVMGGLCATAFEREATILSNTCYHSCVVVWSKLSIFTCYSAIKKAIIKKWRESLKFQSSSKQEAISLDFTLSWKKNNNFGTHSVLTELETCQVWRSFTLWYYARPKTGVIMVYSRRLVGLNYLNGRCILVSLLTIYICITQWLAMLLSLFDYKLTSQGIGLGGKEDWVYKAFMWGGPTKILEYPWMLVRANRECLCTE